MPGRCACTLLLLLLLLLPLLLQESKGEVLRLPLMCKKGTMAGELEVTGSVSAGTQQSQVRASSLRDQAWPRRAQIESLGVRGSVGFQLGGQGVFQTCAWYLLALRISGHCCALQGTSAGSAAVPQQTRQQDASGPPAPYPPYQADGQAPTSQPGSWGGAPPGAAAGAALGAAAVAAGAQPQQQQYPPAQVGYGQQAPPAQAGYPPQQVRCALCLAAR